MPRTAGSRCRSCLRANVFVMLLISGVLVGIALGVGLRYAKPSWTSREILYFKFPGELLLRMLKMLILPLVITSMIAGMASLEKNASSWLGLRAVIYYFTTTLIAVIIGIVLVVSIRPGSSQSAADLARLGSSKSVSAIDSLLDLIRNAFPDNVIDACIRKVQTVLTEIVPTTAAPSTPDANSTATIAATTTEAALSNATTAAPASAPPTYKASVTSVWGSNLLGIIVFCLAFGGALNKVGDRARVAREFFEGSSEAVLTVVKLVIWYTPIGIIFLVAGKIIEMEDVARTLSQLGLYAITVISGLVIHAFIVLPLIFLITVRRNPFAYMSGCTQALLTAVSTASSSATLPVTFNCIENINGVSKQVSRFVLPIGATINMDGTALYEAVATVFIAQLNGMTLDFVQLIIVSVTATAAAVGAAGVPEAGLVTMVIVLTAVGLPTDDVTLILAIDWFLDRLRTAVNVWGDSVGAAVVESLSRRQLEQGVDNTGFEVDWEGGKDAEVVKATHL